MAAPLYEALLQYKSRASARYHMPGHVGNPQAIPALAPLLPLDVTELPQTGSLFENLGPTRLAEEEAARCFQTKGSFLSAGGSSLCVSAMLALACPKGSTVLADRCIHRSALNAITLLNLTPVWLWRTPEEGAALPGRVSPETVEKALQKHPEAAAVYLTAPDYYGVLPDVPAIAGIAHRHGVPLLVDAAHGAHLAHTPGGLAPWLCGADMAACSAHKTLPALTGGAWLHVQREAWLAHTHEAMALFGSTSPSYPILLSLDLCRDWLEREGREALFVLSQQVAELKTQLRAWGFSLPTGAVDPLRLAVDTGVRGVSGTRAAEHLRAHGVEPEYADSRFLVLIPSAFHTKEEIRRLQNALHSLPRKEASPVPPLPLPAPPEAVLTPGEVFGLPIETVNTRDALGRICAGIHTPCPPAVPLLMPGERIDGAALELLTNYEISKLNVVK